MNWPALLAPAALLLSACATTDAPPSAPPPTPTASASCDSAKAQFAVGQPYTAAVAEEARVAAGAQQVRRLEPGKAYTMEYLEGRLNLEVDAAGTIISARCG